MGKGDQKSKKGKINAGSYGVTRKRKKSVAFVAPKPKAKKVATTEEAEAKPKKAAAKKPAAKKAAAKKPAAKKAPAKK